MLDYLSLKELLASTLKNYTSKVECFIPYNHSKVTCVDEFNCIILEFDPVDVLNRISFAKSFTNEIFYYTVTKDIVSGRLKVCL